MFSSIGAPLKTLGAPITPLRIIHNDLQFKTRTGFSVGVKEFKHAVGGGCDSETLQRWL